MQTHNLVIFRIVTELGNSTINLKTLEKLPFQSICGILTHLACFQFGATKEEFQSIGNYNKISPLVSELCLQTFHYIAIISQTFRDSFCCQAGQVSCTECLCGHVPLFMLLNQCLTISLLVLVSLVWKEKLILYEFYTMF